MPFVQPLDLALILQSAQNFTANKMKREDREFDRQQYTHKLEVERKQQEMMVKIKQAQAKVLQAQNPQAEQESMSDLAALDPKTAMETQDQIGKMETATLERAKKTRDMKLDQGLRGAQAMDKLLANAVAQGPNGPQINIKGLFGAASQLSRMAQQQMVDPQQAEAVVNIFRRVQQAEQAGAGGEFNTDKVLSEMSGAVGEIGKLRQGATFTMDLLGDPEKRKRYQSALEEIGGRAFELGGGDSSDYEWQVRNNPEAVERARAEVEAGKLGRAKAAGTKVTVVNREPGQTYDPVTMGARTAMQKEAMASLGMLSNLKSIDISKAPEYQGAIPEAKAAGLRFADWLVGLKEGGKNDEFLAGRRAFQEQIEGVFNQYRRQITGAQAAFVELERLKDSILNKDLAPSEMRGSYKRFVKEMERVDRIRRRVLRKGFNVSDPEAMGRAMDDEYLRDMGKPASYEEDVKPVIEELRQRNPDISDEEIENTLESLGL